MHESTVRIIDANLNRASEAARVIEDVARFALSSGTLAQETKSLRHSIRKAPGALGIAASALLSARDSDGDVSRTQGRSGRNGLSTLAAANFNRLQEAFRVLEEVTPSKPELFSDLRYKAYSLEKRMGRLLSRRSPDILAGPCVCVIVTRGMVDDPIVFIREVIRGGAGMIQLREKSLADKDFEKYASQAHEITSETGALLVINDRADIAGAVRADGVHVGQKDLDPRQARRIVGEEALVGVSTHCPEEVEAACANGADYIGFGPVFETKTKAGAAASPEALKETVDMSGVPVYAIGGIGPDNVHQVVEAGAKCVAVCASVAAAGDPAKAVESMVAGLAKVTGDNETIK